MIRHVLAVLLFLSICGNVFLYSEVANNQPAQSQIQKEYSYLSKRIFVDNQNDILINFIPLRRAIREYVGLANKPSSSASTLGVYFEYLPSGTSIGVNEKDEVALVSLSKVPLVMSIYKKIERGNLSKTDILTIKREHLNQDFGELWKRGEGAQLSVEELVQLALVDSDNTAYNVLSDELTAQELNEVYEGLDVQLTLAGESLLVSPKSYSSIFRSLYLSSFLSEQSSNDILNILTTTPFNDKLDAGVPADIKLAHKIGVFEIQDASQDVFIDCGITYVPNRPYILCIFVKGTNEQAQQHMSAISKMVYEYIRIVKGE
ncbi:MAG: serine hydrolase [Candidatus Andersenbacteria bacterium]